MYKTIFATIFLTAFVMVSQSQSVSKKIKLTKGQKLESVVRSTLNISQEMMGQQMEVNSNTTATSVMEVKDITNQTFTLSNLIKRVVLTTSAMGQNMDFDSDKPEDMQGQIGQQFKSKIGVPNDIIVNKQGKITEIKAVDSASDMMSSFAGGEMSIGSTYPLLTVLPASAVKPGDTWTDSSGTPETMKLVNTYTLKQVSGGDAIISITGQMYKSGKMEQQGMEFTMNLNGISTGESVYDVNTGILKRNTTKMKVTGTMDIMGQSVPVTMNTTAETAVNKL